MKKYLLLIGILLFTIQEVAAQYVHHSQYYSDPMKLNPAMTGNFNGNYRVGLNGRSQWASVTEPYNTMSAFGDFAFLKTRNNDWAGAGFRMLYDNAGDGDLTTYEIQGNFAIHKSFTDNFYASLGAAVLFRQKSLNPDAFYFSNQWNSSNFNPDATTGELLEFGSFNQNDTQGGIVFTYFNTDKFRLRGGFSLTHISQPRDSFLGGNSRLGTFYTVHASAAISNGRWGVEPGIYYTSTQSNAGEVIGGANVTIPLGGSYSNTSGYIGAWTRLNDAAILVAGLSMNQYRVMLSYDMNISELSQASKTIGGFEFSITHVGFISSWKKSPQFCPRF